MISVSVYSLVVTSPQSASLLILCPDEDLSNDISRRFIPILIGHEEAKQIGFAMNGRRPKRPTTHDMFMDTITNLDAMVSRVEIHDVVGKVFYSRLVLRTNNRIIEIDARPSDAISLALRQNAPICVSEKVISDSSVLFTPSNKKENEEMEKFHSFIEGINPDDFLLDEE